MRDEIIKALNWRYAVQVFDPTKTVDDQKVQTILEAGRLSPSSFGLEPWKFIVVDDKEIRAKLCEAGYGQPKITEAAKLIVIAIRSDARENLSQDRVARVAKVHDRNEDELAGMKQMIDGSISTQSDTELEGWLTAQTYIALGMMLETAALLGVDAAPMEGFSEEQVDEILGLKEKNLQSVVLLALGYRGEDPAAKRKKVRRELAEVVEVIK